MLITEAIKDSLKFDRLRLSHYKVIASTSVEGRLTCKWDRRRKLDYYYIKQPGDDREVPVSRKPNSRVWKLQRKRFADRMIQILSNNIQVKELFLNLLLPDDPSDVLESLPKAYRPNPVFRPKGNPKAPQEHGIRADMQRQDIPQSENPKDRHQLTLTTSFGLLVRTKGELAIAEMLYSMGIEFYYEKALHLEVLRREKETGVPYWTTWTYYPDFTIILPSDRIVYWEHKGMLDDYGYSEHDAQKSVDYNINRIYQPHNLIVTEEGPKNTIDFENIKIIAQALLR